MFGGFRSWLVMQGREVFEAALADPDSLAERRLPSRRRAFDEIAAAEEFGYVGAEVYEEMTGRELPYGEDADSGEREPAGEPWRDDGPAEFGRRLPRLAARLTR